MKHAVFLLALSLLPIGTLGAAEPGRDKPRRILFLGNSITLHGPAPDIGWTGNWGMAASAPEKDYVHRLADALARRWGVPPQVQVANIADFERRYDACDLDALLKPHLDFAPDLVVVAIGENVPELGSDEAKGRFKAACTRLLTMLKRGDRPAIVV